MSRFRIVAVLLVATAAVSLGVCIALWTNNPSIDNTSLGSYDCLAPYDTVLTGASDFRGGELPPDWQEIASRCNKAGHRRFYAGLPFGTFGLLASAAVVVIAWRRSGTRVT